MVPIHASTVLRQLWRTSAPLTALSTVMIPALALAAAGLVFDPRLITGAPAWMKPAKFAVSIGIYSITLAWVFTYLQDWVRTRRVVGWVTAAVLLLEIAIIDVQAWRGTASHFNVGTPLDATLFRLMGAAIVVQTITSVAVAVALWRQPFTDRALGWALRLGMTMTIIGATSGGLMIAPTAEQLDSARATKQMLITGAHTVGAPDGGPGLPVTGWSREHGDLRVAHFVGLHALQAFALLVVALPRRWPDAVRSRFALTAFAGYGALFVLLLGQALAGESIAAPGARTIMVFGGWLTITAGALLRAARVQRVEGTVIA